MNENLSNVTHSFADAMLRCVPSRAGNVLTPPERKVRNLSHSHLGTVYRDGWARARASPWAACAWTHRQSCRCPRRARAPVRTARAPRAAPPRPSPASGNNRTFIRSSEVPHHTLVNLIGCPHKVFLEQWNSMENYGPRFLILRGSKNSAAIGESLKTRDRYSYMA